MYANQKKLIAALTITKVNIWIWGAMTVIVFMAIIQTFIDGTYKKNFVSFMGFALFHGTIWVLNLNKKSRLDKVERIDNIFRNDDDGVMDLEQLANALNYDNKKIEKCVMYLISKRYLINCRFDDNDRRKIVFRDVNIEESYDLASVNCPSCGTLVQARPNHTVKCPACGRMVKL